MTPNTEAHRLPPLQHQPPGLYRHYKGGWYEVLGTVRCSETLQSMTIYRALYEVGDGTGPQGSGTATTIQAEATGNLAHGVLAWTRLWVRPTEMFASTVRLDGPDGAVQPRFAPADPARLPLHELGTARALVALLQGQAQRAGLTLRRPPPEPTTCCGRGCNGCVWEGFYEAMHHWRDDALAALNF